MANYRRYRTREFRSVFNVGPFRCRSSGGGLSRLASRGQATVTYMLQGSSQHEDSMGNLGTLCAGDVQWMVAGRGASLPYFASMAILKFEHQISGTSCGTSVAPPSVGGCWYIHMKFHKRRSTFNQELPPGWTAFVYILRGSLSIRSETFPSHTAVVLSSDPEENHVGLSAGDDGADVVLFAAEPLNQPIARFGPFVMNTKEELKKALLDYRMEINGFENARRWKSSIGGR
ncbi:hypothetical protein RSAG8_02083, partial [Rhizoctonia solani AG-8 WAC10335]